MSYITVTCFALDFVVINQSFLRMTLHTDTALPSVLRVETEQEKEVTHQLKQANDTVARLQDELSDFRQRSAPLWEKEMKDRDSKIYSSYRHSFQFLCIVIINSPLSIVSNGLVQQYRDNVHRALLCDSAFSRTVCLCV